MAAMAAKYGHCEVGYPVAYRVRSPFRPEITAPLDLSTRLAEIYADDHELDRAILGLREYEEILHGGLDWALGGGELFGTRLDPIRPTQPAPSALGEAERLADHRRRFTLNQLRFLAEGARFRPPWTVSLVQTVHSVLFQKLDVKFTPGTLREQPFVGLGPAEQPVFRACPPESISRELAAVLEWVDRVGPTLSPIIPAAVLLQCFQAIRPFPSGNAAVGWMLSQYYFHLFGLPNAPLVPLAHAMAGDADLRLRLALWTEASGSYAELIDYTVDALLGAYRTGVDRWLDRAPPTDYLEETALRLLSRARRSSGWFSAQEAASWVGGRSESTVLRHLNDLVRRGIFESLGQTRAKRYRFVSRTSLLPSLMRRVREPGRGPPLTLDEGAPTEVAEDRLPPRRARARR